jgi:hypothetical protein
VRDRLGYRSVQLAERTEVIRRRDVIINNRAESMRALPAGTETQTMLQERDPAPARDVASVRVSEIRRS